VALIACRECGQNISDQAPACPHCGMPHQTITSPPPPGPSREAKRLLNDRRGPRSTMREKGGPQTDFLYCRHPTPTQADVVAVRFLQGTGRRIRFEASPAISLLERLGLLRSDLGLAMIDGRPRNRASDRSRHIPFTKRRDQFHSNSCCFDNRTSERDSEFCCTRSIRCLRQQ
jgi:hypothetical protein